MTGQTADRALAIIERLARDGSGLPLSEIADSLSIPRSAAHRVLADLRDDGYVRQEQDGGSYGLTAKIISLAMTYLSAAGVSDAIQPILDGLADRTGEVVVMAVIDAGRLVRVAKARGARQGLVYNPDEGSEVYLATTSNGHAWLSCLTDEEALHLVAKQGFSRPSDGPRAPKSLRELLDLVAAARARGFAKIFETYVVGTSAMAAPIRRPGTGEPLGTLSVAGPMGRFTDAVMDRFAPALIASADAIAEVASTSPLFEQAPDRPRAASDPLDSPLRFQPDETAPDSQLERIRRRRKRSSRNRALAIVALLAHHPWGLRVEAIAEALDTPLAAARRLIAGLVEWGYVHGADREGRVRLRTKLPALGLAYLGASGITDVARPILEDLARRTGELVRLAVAEDGTLSWAAKVQGARTGLLYEPGAEAENFGPGTANGLAWLSCVGGDRRPVGQSRHDRGELFRSLEAVRRRGFAAVSKADDVGTSAIAAPIRQAGSGTPLGTVSIAGPTIRLSPERIDTIAPWLLACAEELGAVAGSSPTFRRRRTGATVPSAPSGRSDDPSPSSAS